MTTILVVDDDKDSAEMMQMLLRHAQVTVATVHIGADAVLYTRNYHPEIVLMDLLLPAESMDGWQAIHAIKSDPDISNTVVIAMTAVSNQVNKQRAFDAGCDDYLEKPFTHREMFACLEYYLS